jgi:ribosomal-protein-alanine N-acetyltransferase
MTPTTDLIIAPASHGDLAAVHKLETLCFPAPWRREFFESELDAAGRFNLVAKRGGRVIGYLFAMWFFDEMHVNKIAVAESERRRGIALSLMQQCLDFAAMHEIRTISLEVRQSNNGAQEFYLSLDFEPLYVRPRYYPDGEAAVIMVLEMPE